MMTDKKPKPDLFGRIVPPLVVPGIFVVDLVSRRLPTRHWRPVSVGGTWAAIYLPLKLLHLLFHHETGILKQHFGILVLIGLAGWAWVSYRMIVHLFDPTASFITLLYGVFISLAFGGLWGALLFVVIRGGE